MSRLLPRLLCNIAIALGATAAHAIPTATDVSPKFGFSFSEYLGDATLGGGQLGLNNQVFWVHEGTGEYKGQQVDSWFLVFEPTADRVKGSLRFDGRIEAVFDSRAELQASSSFESDAHDYRYHRAVGLEGKDRLQVRGQELRIDWSGGLLGDHVRVLTRSSSIAAPTLPAAIETPPAPVAPIPEPSTYALMLLGLGAMGAYARRRRQR